MDSVALENGTMYPPTDNTTLMNGRYVVRVTSSCEVFVTCTDGYTSTTWLDQQRRAWWITWDAVSPGTLSTEPSDNTANGVLVVAHPEGKFTISSDRFGTTPAFYRQDHDELLVSNDFDTVASGSCSEPDEIGFWELVLFETPLANRTLLRHVKYLCPGTTLTFALGVELQTRRYWNFAFETLDVKTDEECAALCGETLREGLNQFASLPTVLPIGGGLDSRLLAAALHKVSPRAPVTGVTYGYDHHILEYVYAKKVFQRLGWLKPLFHKLTPDSYIQCMEPLIRRTGGLIGMQNGHFFDYLRSQGASETPILSGMYSDGVCGFDASCDLSGVDKLTAFVHVSSLWNKAASLELPDHIFEGIYADLQAIRADWRKGSSITSFNEYMYVRERNAKFHLLMADSWRMFAPVKLPFAEPNVAMAFLALPTRFRQHKRCTILATHFLAPELDGLKNVRSGYWKFGLGSKVIDLELAWVRRVNGWLRRACGSRFQFVERAETERPAFNLQFYHTDLCLHAYSKLLDYGLCDNRTVHKLVEQKTRTLPPFSYYQILSNIHVLNHYAK